VHPTLPALLHLEWSHLLPWILRWRISIHLGIHFTNTENINTKKNSYNNNHAVCSWQQHSPRLWVCVRYANGCKTFFSLIVQDVSIFSTDMGWMLPPVPNRSTPASFSSLSTWERKCKETDHMEMGYAAIHISLHIVIVTIINHGSGLWNCSGFKICSDHLLFGLLLDLSLGSHCHYTCTGANTVNMIRLN
jgi:hypothetical protein